MDDVALLGAARAALLDSSVRLVRAAGGTVWRSGGLVAPLLGDRPIPAHVSDPAAVDAGAVAALARAQRSFGRPAALLVPEDDAALAAAAAAAGLTAAADDRVLAVAVTELPAPGGVADVAIRIRPAAEAADPGIQRRHAAVRAQTSGTSVELEVRALPLRLRSGRILLGAEQGHELVGVAAVERISTPYGVVALLDGVGVLEAWRGRGIGTALAATALCDLAGPAGDTADVPVVAAASVPPTDVALYLQAGLRDLGGFVRYS
jgi:GNAT superfamily N-acetyltransferase